MTNSKIVLECEEKIINEFPTPSQMKAFAEKYTKDEWSKITNNRNFINVFTEDLTKAREIANIVLGKIEEKQETKPKNESGNKR